MDKNLYLSHGHLTNPTTYLKNVAGQVEGQGVLQLESIFKITNSALKLFAQNYFSVDEFEKKLFMEHMRRPAEEIIKSGYHYGCDEYGVVFATIARIKNIPTKYIQCVDLVSYTKRKSFDDVNGHVFLECFIDGRNYLINSTKGTLIEIKTESDKKATYVVNRPDKKKYFIESYAGIDSWEQGIRSHDDLMKSLCETAETYFKNHDGVTF